MLEYYGGREERELGNARKSKKIRDCVHKGEGLTGLDELNDCEVTVSEEEEGEGGGGGGVGGGGGGR